MAAEVCSRCALAVVVAVGIASVPARAQTHPASIVLPERLPAQCVQQAASDYAVPVEIVLAIVRHESRGRSVASRNRNGTYDLGVAQHNTGSWVPYFRDRYGIDPQSLLDSPCQSIRALAYTLRRELDSRECAGTDIWCAVGRYHAPNNLRHRSVYVPKVAQALQEMLSSGRFEPLKRRSGVAHGSDSSRPAPSAPVPGQARQAGNQRSSATGPGVQRLQMQPSDVSGQAADRTAAQAALMPGGALAGIEQRD